MARNRSPNRDKAFEIYKKYYARITAKEIAKLLDEKPRNISLWKKLDKWKERYNPKGGAPKGNQNALGNKGGPPLQNQNARKEGWYSKYYPTVARNLIKEAEAAGGSPLEILWAQIMTQWIAIIRAQEIMFVTDKDEMIKEVKKEKEFNKSHTTKAGVKDVQSGSETEWEFQFAWDRQANFLNAQSRAMTTLSNLIKRYDDMLHADPELATEEQKLRVEKLKGQINNPELKHRIDKEKLKLEKERFEHQKKVDESKIW